MVEVVSYEVSFRAAEVDDCRVQSCAIALRELGAVSFIANFVYFEYHAASEYTNPGVHHDRTLFIQDGSAR